MIRSLQTPFRRRGSFGCQADRPTARFHAVVVLRAIGSLAVLAFVTNTLNTAPRPGFAGRQAIVLAALIVFVAAVLALALVSARSAAQPRLQGPQAWLIAFLVALTASSAALAVLQPNGSWELGPALIACFAAVAAPPRSRDHGLPAVGGGPDRRERPTGTSWNCGGRARAHGAAVVRGVPLGRRAARPARRARGLPARRGAGRGGG